MATRRGFLRAIAATGAAATVAGGGGAGSPGAEDRAYWLGVLRRLADPVLGHLARRELKRVMPVECVVGDPSARARYSHLEALGRLLAGLAPWLELDPEPLEEGRDQARYADLARQAIDSATDPDSPDFLDFGLGGQTLVDSAFLAHALIRAPRELWEKLGPTTRANLVRSLRSTRKIKPPENNWLLFRAMIEAALGSIGEPWESERVEYAVRRHEQWYKGDGAYGDGPEFHWDYYNSFVIQPMLLDALRTVSNDLPGREETLRLAQARARRYAAVQERLISPEGTFPAIGRSLAYRFGAFQLLGQMALAHQLPEGVAPSQVRCALTAVIRRMIEAPGTFDANGWLTIGFCGHQPRIGETYISTGSLYLCAVGLLPLGLPARDEFWSGPPTDWTARKLWSGQDLAADHALRG